jgi:hypothetical protein
MCLEHIVLISIILPSFNFNYFLLIYFFVFVFLVGTNSHQEAKFGKPSIFFFKKKASQVNGSNLFELSMFRFV